MKDFLNHWMRLQAHMVVRGWIIALERVDEKVHPYKHLSPWNEGD